MKHCFLIFIIALLASSSCTKNTQTGGGNANYILFDSANFVVNTPISVQINAGTSVMYKGLTWQYNGGYYFNGYDFIYLYGNNNDSIYIDYVDTVSSAFSTIYEGYRQN